MNDKMMFWQGKFKNLEDFPYAYFKDNFDDLWELMESYNGVKSHLDAEIQNRLGLRSTDHLEEFVEKLFPIGSRISFLAHGNIRSVLLQKYARMEIRMFLCLTLE